MEGRTAHPIALRLDGDLGRPRLVVAFRPLLVVPHLCWLGLWTVPAALGVVAAWAAALATGRVPGPLHRFLASFVRETAHVSAFLHLVGRPYPGFLGREGSYPVDLTIARPTGQLRLGVLARILLALPALLLAAAFAFVALVPRFSAGSRRSRRPACREGCATSERPRCATRRRRPGTSCS